MREYSVKSDVFSLGCVMYEMISGRVVFPAKTEIVLLQQIDKCKITFLSHSCKPPWRDLTHEMLKKLPDDRPEIRQICMRREIAEVLLARIASGTICLLHYLAREAPRVFLRCFGPESIMKP